MPRIITDFLDEAVKAVPQKIAFVEEKRSVTYEQLRSEAYRIAMPVITEGLRKKPVAIYLDKSIFCISAMLAVAYSGNFYSVIDTQMPTERIEKIFETLEPQSVITDKKHLDKVKTFYDGKNIIVVDEPDSLAVSEEVIEDCKSKILETDVLYVLFTSGSTGIPKGVVTPHRAVTNYIIALTDAYKINENTVIGNQIPFYFVMSVLDIFGCIAKRAQTYIIPKSKFMFPGYLVKYLHDNKINLLSWVPSALCMIANTDAFSVADLPHIKTVIFGGEVMPIKQLKAWQKAIPDAIYINGYGSTEITDGCTYYIVNREFNENDILPIGIPFANSDVIVIDEDGKPITEGVGELCIRSDSMTYGYYKDPKKTSEVYIQNPINDCYPEIVYRMGDLVRFNKYGELEYVGRKDFQIKHMGRRIELGEIEANISGIEGITENCCVYDSEQKRIVLFYTGMIDEDCLIKEIRNKLVDYMQPKKFMKLTVMPHNQNGKIDRKLLVSQLNDKE